MPDRDYNLLFNAPNDAILKFLDDLIARLTKVDQLADSVKPKIASMASGASRSVNTLAKAAETLANNMAKVEQKSNDAAGALGKVRTQSVGTGQLDPHLGEHSDYAMGTSENGSTRALHLNGTLLRISYAAIGDPVRPCRCGRVSPRASTTPRNMPRKRPSTWSS